ncbi:type IV secretion protein A [Photobacterium phosphoreum]|uniref:TrbC/VirB2 family protein n=2 Tax=Photobacterium phosphoreum TaxID=659 RepID=UPI000D177C6A|nr:TrbC/VirB2 family protein [Photobacterium phosphoreum]PSU67909.1 type IV secretion protein A [Photobacterium phosphoreum]PSW07906.1 type IV secretion protein A [Photobacterium phosphoreum]
MRVQQIRSASALFGVHGAHPRYFIGSFMTKSSSSHSLMTFMVFMAIVLCSITPDVAFASGGVTQVNEFFTKLATALRVVSSGVVTVAIMWAGYKVAWTPAGVQDVAKPFGGALLIGAAAEIGRFLLP